MIDAFFNRGLLMLPSADRNPLKDRVIAQHYSIPTQLLDWSLDPFIALYFAVEDFKSDADAAIYYMRPASVTSTSSDITFPFEQKLLKILPPVLDERVRVQRSIFTLQNYGDAEEFTPLDDRNLEGNPNDENNLNREVELIGKIIIPKDRKPQILFELLEMGIDASLIYPGLQGIGTRIATIANLENYAGDVDF